MGFFDRLKDGLSRTRSRVMASVGVLPRALTEEFFTGLEEALLGADIGVDSAGGFVEAVREAARKGEVINTAEAYAFLKKKIVSQFTLAPESGSFTVKPWVIVYVGVNGVGKTTTIGKMAHEFRAQTKKVMIGAADTFRAGAVEQIKIWAERTQSELISQQDGADPASVAYDALAAARARGADILLLDTAGRLHSKGNLMNELEKVLRVIKRQMPDAPHEVLLVIDGTTGQNAIRQAKAFHQVLGVTGLVVTKLDGTAKGGAVVEISRELRVPVCKIGVGEAIEDLQDFDPAAFVDAILGELPDGTAVS